MIRLALNRRQALAALALPALARAQKPGAAENAESAESAESFDAWSERFAADWMRQSAELSTMSQYFGNTPEQAALDRQLTPQTPERRERRRQLAREGLAKAAAFTQLSARQRVEADVLRWSLQRTLAGEPFEDHNFIFNQMSGPQVRVVAFLSETHPLRNPADVAAFNERLAQVGPRVDEALARARAAAAKGLLPPRFILERSRAQVVAFLAPAPQQNVLVEALTRRSERIAALAPEDRQRAIDTAVAAVRDGVRPAWLRVLAFFDEIAPRTGNDAGLWRLPDGAAAYAQALATFTTTTLGADEIHAIGLREVARIEGEMDRVLKTLERDTGTVQQRMTALRAEQQPAAQADASDPRPAILARYRDAVADNIRRSQRLFNLQPQAPVEVRREPALTEKTAAAHYSAPAPDGTRPGVFWLPMPGPDFDLLRVRSLSVHEAVPGHHFQIALQQEQRDLPLWRQRRVFGGGSAHSEGWALYAERLAIDEGWYEGDPLQLLGALDSQLFRARRLVVDTGLHAKRWTREQAIAYGIGAQEVERYVVNPGQACAYMIGMLRILQLRDEAQAALKDRFDPKAFHDLVLKTGSVPLDVLGQVVQRWSSA